MKKRLCWLICLALTALCWAPALGEEIPRLRLTWEGGALDVTLEDNSAARSLVEQLPLTLSFEDYNGTEKIAYPPEALDLSGAPDSCDPEAGTLAYYAPWGNLCIFYRDFGPSQGLVPLGKAEGAADLLDGMEESFTAVLEVQAQSQAPAACMTRDIAPEGLTAVYQAQGEKVAAKISAVETGSNYLRPQLIGGLAQGVDALGVRP